jgi:uncharacterized protein (DUF1684 family)
MAGSQEASPEDDYRRSIEEWYRGRIEFLTSDTGYLTLVGLSPLDKGANRLGSGENSSVMFPEKAPKNIGTIYLKDNKLEIAIMPGVNVAHKGEPVDKMYIQSDADGDPTKLEMGTITFHVIERAGELYVRISDRESELRAGFDGIERFPVDPRYRVVGRFETYDPPKPLKIPNVLGYENDFPCPGAIVFEFNGKTHRLEPLYIYEDEFFIVFGDETSGMETYGGGRFLYTPLPDDSGKVVLDFNKAYNPSCAFTRHSTCPLPHKANVLSFRVESGEKAWGGGSH